MTDGQNHWPHETLVRILIEHHRSCTRIADALMALGFASATVADWEDRWSWTQLAQEVANQRDARGLPLYPGAPARG